MSRSASRSLLVPLVVLASILYGGLLTAAEGPSSTERPAEVDPEDLPTNEECATCHASPELRRSGLSQGSQKDLLVTDESLAGSVHARLSCIACHSSVRDLPHGDAEAIGPATCVPCHDETVEEYERAVHGRGGVREGTRNALPCSTCHGPAHEILSSRNPEAPTFRARVPETCGGCHGELKMVVEVLDPSLRKPLFAYQESVHGRAVGERGSMEAAVCTDCHGVHEILPPTDSRSPIFRFNVPGMCGQCHEDVLQEYADSVHGQATSLGVGRSPVCTDCHGIHNIKSPVDPESSVTAQAIARTTCPQCHQSVSLRDELGLPVERVQSYLDSYHGLALQRGSKVVANCASCHGIHDIYPSRDPRSTVHPSRLTETCGKCHPGANENFTRGKIHDFTPETSGLGAAIDDWVAQVYFLMIVVTIGGMLAHNFLDLRRKADPAHRALPLEHVVSPRLDRPQRVQHAVLAASFILLVLTGFALKFPSSWLSDLFGPGEDVRRLLHRVAAVVMVALGLYHAYYLLATVSGRKALHRMTPTLGDVRDLRNTLAFNLGLRRERPEMPHFGYAEKMEYWAVIWGTVVMGVTGFLLWFKIFATDLGLPLWAIDLARTVHYYEAWLATLAIIVWHFYFVFFDPAVYPMNWGWWNGWVHGRAPEPEEVTAAEQETGG